MVFGHARRHSGQHGAARPSASNAVLGSFGKQPPQILHACSKASAASDLALSNRDQIAKMFSGDKQAANKPVKFELLRLLRFSYMRNQDLPPAGLWTAKSRPSSLLRETQKEKKRLERKIRLAHAKRLKGTGDRSRSRSRSANPRSASVRSASSKKS